MKEQKTVKEKKEKKTERVNEKGREWRGEKKETRLEK